MIETRINETIRDEEGRSTLADILVDPYAEETLTEIRDNFSQYPKKKESTLTREV